MTSGSTGASTLVELTNGNICCSARQMALALCLQPDDRCLNIMPLTHIAGLSNVVLSSVVAGASIVCTDSFQAARFFDLMDEHAPTWYTATPAMHRAILDVARSRRDVISAHPFRFVRTSAAPCPMTLIDELEQCFGVPVVNHYGLTETGPLVSANPLPPGKRKRGSVGLPAGCEVAIMGAGGTLQEHTTVGQVVVRGPNVMQQRDEPGRSGAFVDGWFCTGDEGYLDAEGYLFLTGRLGERINRGGENISPAEIEDALLTHSSVRQAAAFGVPDVVLGQDVAAAVVLADGEHTTASELRSFAAQLLSASKVPTQLLILKDLPMTSSGKVLRRELVEMAKHLHSTATADVGSDVAMDDRMMRLRELLLSIWRDVLGIAEVGPDDDFLMLGGDSTDVTRFITRVREMSGCSVGYAEVFEHRTVSRLAELLKERVTLPSAGSATP
jgi:acyl-CoA synthetase (AMP-forming)/AMP-acid ligase II